MRRHLAWLRAEALFHLYDRRVIWFCWQCDDTKPFWHKHPHHCYVLPVDPPLTNDHPAGDASRPVRDE